MTLHGPSTPPTNHRLSPSVNEYPAGPDPVMALRLLHRLRIFGAVFALPPVAAVGLSEDAFGAAANKLAVSAYDEIQAWVSAPLAPCCRAAESSLAAALTGYRVLACPGSSAAATCCVVPLSPRALGCGPAALPQALPHTTNTPGTGPPGVRV